MSNEFITAKLETTKPDWFLKDGIPIEKGRIITEEYVLQNRAWIEKYLNFFLAYPDLFLDLISSNTNKITLHFYQRILARAAMRYRTLFVTAPRAAAKSFISVLILFVQCVLIPGTQRSITTPGKQQAANILWPKIVELYRYYPLLRREVIGGDFKEMPGNKSTDYVIINFKNGSKLDIAAPLETTRGQRRHGLLIDEVRDHEESKINEIIIPLLNVERRAAWGSVHPDEPNKQLMYMTSAGTKMSFAYGKLVEVFIKSIIYPRSYMVIGFDYRLPMLHGLLSKETLRDIQSDSSYSVEAFSREYGSIWSGGSEESWFNFDKLQKYRKLKNPEMRAINRGAISQFYLLSMDVGRISDQSVVTVFRVNPQAGGRYLCSVVNIIVLGLTAQRKAMTQQVIDLKMLIERYNPKEVVIDVNGLGRGIADLMITEQITPDGIVYPAYGFNNNKDYQEIQPKDAPKILYAMIATSALNAEIHTNAYNRTSNGSVQFLIRETEAKALLLSTKKSKTMTTEEKIMRLMPHEMTTVLFHEMANLRLKKGTSKDMALEQINSRFPKDKYSSLAYGLWRIKELEDENIIATRKKASRQNRQLVFYSGR